MVAYGNDCGEEYETTPNDVLIILGDAGINYYLDESDYELKQELSLLPVTLLCIHGNHEERPEEICSYKELSWHGGIVYAESEFSTLLFAKDGEIYDLEGRSTLVIGGAYSVDKFVRLSRGIPWFSTEQPDDETKRRTETRLHQVGWRVDCVLSHTVPLQYMPHHAFLPGIDQSMVDNSTEEWLDTIERRLKYGSWYAGHFHVDSYEGPIRIVQDDFLEIRSCARTLLGRNVERREQLIYGRSFDPSNYSPDGIAYFQGVSMDVLRQLLAEGFLAPS